MNEIVYNNHDKPIIIGLNKTDHFTLMHSCRIFYGNNSNCEVIGP